MAIQETMRGAVLLGPEQLEIREVPIDQPGPRDILLSVEAATTCGTDVKVFRQGGHSRMLKVPTLFGHEMAGRVAAVGEDVVAFSPGDAVVVVNSAPCEVCGPCLEEKENLCEDLHYINGAYAEFLLIPERFVQRNTHLIPEGLSFERAAMTEPLGCVIHGLNACNLPPPIFACDLPHQGRSGETEVLIFGAGPIGLLFVAVLASEGHRVLLADPNADRLGVGKKLGASEVFKIDRGGGQAEEIRTKTQDKKGATVAIDATGVPEVWLDVVASVRPGGTVNFFGGCPPGTIIPLDAYQIHYNELTIKSTYHHRPDTIKTALNLLADSSLNVDLLLSSERPIEGVEEALRSMMNKESLKVVIKKRLGSH